MPDFVIESIEDPRLDPYRELKRQSGNRLQTFVAEGEKLVLRLLASDCPTESILCTAAARERLAARIPAGIPTYLADTPVISRLIGFQFHRGVLGCGVRPANPSLESLCRLAGAREKGLIVVCPELRDPTNLGTIIRTAHAFGASGLVAGCQGTDPFSRRVLRTSMGSVLKLPIVQTDDWPAALTRLSDSGFATIAAVLDPDAEDLAGADRPARTAVLLGNESEGISAELIARCRRRVTMPMAADVDSLNVAVAAGIVLHHFSVNDSGTRGGTDKSRGAHDP